MAAFIARRSLSAFRSVSSTNISYAFQSQKRLISFSKVLASHLYTEKHEWLVKEGNVGTVGISNHAQEQLGEIVYAETPEVGSVLEAGDIAGCLESVKAASDIFSPVGGKVTEVNENLSSNPGLINSNAENDGWLYKFEIASGTDTSCLMDGAAYKKYLEGLDE